MTEVLVSSFGGVGSKCLLKGLIQTNNYRKLRQSHTHLRTPPDIRALKGRVVIYMFGDPYNALISFFNRRMKRTSAHGFDGRDRSGDLFWVVKHCRNMGSNHRAIDPKWDLAAYLDNGLDLLKMEEHFDNWVNAKVEYPILFLRYETMWSHVAEVCSYVGLPETRANQFPPQRGRESRWEEAPDAIKLKLMSIYGELHKKVTAAPDVWIQRPSWG